MVESFVVVQLLSRVQFFATPWTAAHQASLSFTVSRSLLKLISIEAMMPPNHLILCGRLLLLLSVFPSIRVLVFYFVFFHLVCFYIWQCSQFRRQVAGQTQIPGVAWKEHCDAFQFILRCYIEDLQVTGVLLLLLFYFLVPELPTPFSVFHMYPSHCHPGISLLIYSLRRRVFSLL